MEIDFVQLPPNVTKSELQTFLDNAAIGKAIDEITSMDRKDFYRFWKHSGFSDGQQQLIRDMRYRSKHFPLSHDALALQSCKSIFILTF